MVDAKCRTFRLHKRLGLVAICCLVLSLESCQCSGASIGDNYQLNRKKIKDSFVTGRSLNGGDQDADDNGTLFSPDEVLPSDDKKENNSTRTFKSIGFMGRCNSFLDCYEMYGHLDCIEGRCQCQQGYQRQFFAAYHKHRCVKTGKEGRSSPWYPCASDVHCQMIDVAMNCNNLTNECECRTDLVPVSSDCFKKPTFVYPETSPIDNSPKPMTIFIIIFVVALSVFALMWAIKVALRKCGPQPHVLISSGRSHPPLSRLNSSNLRAIAPALPRRSRRTDYQSFTPAESGLSSATPWINDKPPNYADVIGQKDPVNAGLESSEPPPSYEAVVTHRN